MRIENRKKYIAVLMTILCIIMLFPQRISAVVEDPQRETVRVGFFEMNGYHMQDEDGNRSGYGYDTLRLMARYWNVDYEYIGYDKSWNEMRRCLKMVKLIWLLLHVRLRNERRYLTIPGQSEAMNVW